MKKRTAILLQIVTVVFAISVFIFLLWEPLLEGRNAKATLFEIYFQDTFLAICYMASTLFFLSLYQTYRIWGLVGQNKTDSLATAKALKIIKYCSMALLTLIFLTVAYLSIFLRERDDIAGGVFMGNLIGIFLIIVTGLSSKYEKIILKRLKN